LAEQGVARWEFCIENDARDKDVSAVDQQADGDEVEAKVNNPNARVFHQASVNREFSKEAVDCDGHCVVRDARRRMVTNIVKHGVWAWKVGVSRFFQ
jgi:hypothetical protein